MRIKINSEYLFVDKENTSIRLTVYIDYEKGTYDIVQDHQEGIFCNTNNTETETNKKYMVLAIEALDFIQKDLYDTITIDETENEN